MCYLPRQMEQQLGQRDRSRNATILRKKCRSTFKDIVSQTSSSLSVAFLVYVRVLPVPSYGVGSPLPNARLR